MKGTEIPADYCFDVFQFPDNFHFFSYVHNKSIFISYLPKFLVIFAFIQATFAVFLPFFIISMETGKDSLISRLIVNIIGFESYSTFLQDKIISNRPFIFLLSIIAIYLICRYFYGNNIVTTIFIQLRVYSLFFIPSIFFINVLFITFWNYSYSIHNEILQIKSTKALIQQIFILIIIIFFKYQTSPLLYDTPLFGGNNLPSRLIPVDRWISVLSRIFLFAIIFLFPCKASYLFFSTFEIIITTIDIKSIFRHPFLDVFNNALITSSKITAIVVSFLVYVKVFTDDQISDKTYLIISLTSFLTLIFIFYNYFGYNHDFIVSCLVSNEPIQTTSKETAMAIAQIAFIEERINENVINCLSDIYNKTSDFHVLLYLVYCKLSAKNNFYNNDPNLINEVYIMMNTKNICYTSKYAVYQIFKLFSSTRSEFLPIPTLNDFIDRIHKYLCKSDNFWTLMIEGRVATAARLNYELGHELHLLKEEFRILESFYPNNPTILHYKKSFFFDDTNSTINSNLPLNKNSTQSVSNAASTKVSNSSSNQSIQFKEVTNPEINLKSSTNSDISTYDEQIMRNIKNMLKINYSPLYIYLYLVFTVIFLAVAFCYLTYPFISLKDALSNTSIIPIFIKPTINIIHNWMKLTLCDHYLSHSPNYSFVSNDTVQVWNLKNLTDLDQMFVYLKKDRLKNLAHTQENVTQFMHLFTQWSSIQSINPLKTIWLESSIPYFPGANDNAMKDILIDLHSLLFYITSQLKINDVDEYGIPFNSFIYHNDIFRRHFNLSISVSLKLLDSLYAMENIIDDSRKLLSNDFLIINCAIFFSFLIPIIGIIHYFTCKHLYNFIVYHFRPSSHPNSTKFNDLKRTNKIEPFTTSKSTIKLIIALFLMSIVYIT
ncbi:hypothetical protein TRFO_01497 [Tritrichomonas foetus]|uniref:Uncharacterized protein n=1 Tax=Tritrichomonas foetus TaxID=1144522 RepID=A0A1J4JYN7_9EUKA|nr:hypothetical protein TRFO_01497 [Tritrichomonas foetus]|eukprot:OHT03810.1 hypothetical protein TRFO_01497 [Tritrichomonas foetus]